jgi:acetyl esterase/lipase
MINLTQERKGFEAIGNTYAVAAGVERKDILVGSVPCSWFTPMGVADDSIVIYIHGGAFIYGSVESHAPLVSYIAQELNRKVLIIDYRLAPENPFPAGIDDCLAVINAVIEQNPQIRFGIIGDSAGGNLAMAANLLLRETGGAKPAYTIVNSPLVDLECKNASYTRNKIADTVLARQYLVRAVKMYAPGWDISIPVLSPVNGCFSGVAPVLILCGSDEILEDDAINLHKQLIHYRVEAELKRFEGQLHVWPFMDINTEASRNALREMMNFVARHYMTKY